jgi:cell division protein FtsQ
MTAPATQAPATTVQATAKRGRPDPWKTMFFVVAICALLGGIAWALLGSSFFVVRSVQVSVSGPVSRAKVLAAAGLRLGTPLIRVDTAAIERRIDRVTQVQSARVSRSWPDTVLISTVPRTPMFAVRAGHGYDVMDSYGVVLGRDSRRPAGLVLLKPPPGPVKTLRGKPAVLTAGTVLRTLPGWLRHRVVGAKAVTAERVILLLRRHITVVWGGANAGPAKAEELFVLLRTKATYYDVSDPRSAMTGWPARG